MVRQAIELVDVIVAERRDFRREQTPSPLDQTEANLAALLAGERGCASRRAWESVLEAVHHAPDDKAAAIIKWCILPNVRLRPDSMETELRDSMERFCERSSRWPCTIATQRAVLRDDSLVRPHFRQETFTVWSRDSIEQRRVVVASLVGRKIDTLPLPTEALDILDVLRRDPSEAVSKQAEESYRWVMLGRGLRAVGFDQPIGWRWPLLAVTSFVEGPSWLRDKESAEKAAIEKAAEVGPFLTISIDDEALDRHTYERVLRAIDTCPVVVFQISDVKRARLFEALGYALGTGTTFFTCLPQGLAAACDVPEWSLIECLNPVELTGKLGRALKQWCNAQGVARPRAAAVPV